MVCERHLEGVEMWKCCLEAVERMWGDICMVWEGCIEGVGGCLSGRLSGGCGDVVWNVLGGCLEGVGRMPGGCGGRVSTGVECLPCVLGDCVGACGECGKDVWKV